MIGIVTFHRAVNYGAVLQTYGLEKKIEKLGGECEVVDYRCPFIESEYKLICKKDYWPIRFELPYFRRLASSVASVGMKKKKRKRFYAFLSKYLQMSPVYNSCDELEKDQDRYHAFITGSDQVWNPSLTGDDDVYFLKFVKDSKKRFSYAASLGNVGKGFQLESKFVKQIESFENISVREESGKNYIADAANRNSEVHIDPTLLLTRSDWEEVAEKPEEKGYVLIYSVCEPHHLVEAAKEIAQKENLQVIYLKDKVFSRDGQVKYVKAASPEQYVGYFQHADYVVTNSFHGTVFSIIFQKQFCVELDNGIVRNQRVSDLLDLLGIKGRDIIKRVLPAYKNAIDWKSVDEKLTGQRTCAEEYLKQIISQK